MSVPASPLRQGKRARLAGSAVRRPLRRVPRPARGGAGDSTTQRSNPAHPVSFVNAIAVLLRGLPLPARWAIVGAAPAGVIGAIAGLVIGLRVYAPTAVFAVVEPGLPAAVAGGVGFGCAWSARAGYFAASLALDIHGMSHIRCRVGRPPSGRWAADGSCRVTRKVLLAGQQGAEVKRPDAGGLRA